MAASDWASLLRLADQGATFHIIDTETTGLSATANRVIEVATVTLRGGRIVDRFESLVNPGVVVPPRITQLTGITGAMLVNAPPPESAYRAWRAYLGQGGEFVAHNAHFDWDFLKTEFSRQRMDWPFKRQFCTVRLARHCLPHLRKHGLGHLIEHFGIRVSDRHRALADVEATAEVFLRCLDHLRGGPAPALEKAPETAERRVPPPAPAAPPGWDDLLAYVRARSNPTAALLAQHAGIAGREPDGALVMRITPVYKDRLDQEARKRDLVEEAIKAVYGPGTYLRLEPRV